MQINCSNISCGVYELYDLAYTDGYNLSDNIMQELSDDWGSDVYQRSIPPFAFLIFSDRISNGNGVRVARELKELGATVFQSVVGINPNHNSRIRIWTVRFNKKSWKNLKNAMSKGAKEAFEDNGY